MTKDQMIKECGLDFDWMSSKHTVNCVKLAMDRHAEEVALEAIHLTTQMKHGSPNSRVYLDKAKKIIDSEY